MTTGRVLLDGVAKGIGFAVAPLLALTACHVIQDALDADDEIRTDRQLTLETDDGDVFPAHVTRFNRDLDVAALTLSVEVHSWLSINDVYDGAAWRVSARPLKADPMLSGVVTSCHRVLATESGGEVDLIQLHVYESLGDFGGYSGSPIHLAEPSRVADEAAVGILIEQARWRMRPTGQLVAPVANVLFATPIAVAMAALGLMPATPPDVELQKYRERMKRVANVEGEVDLKLIEETRREVVFRYVFGE
jgi:Trypsin-like peptidase domain